jgi:hypothetical protein
LTSPFFELLWQIWAGAGLINENVNPQNSQKRIENNRFLLFNGVVALLK